MDQIDLVIVGLGYVGLPLARRAVECGLRVVGYDVSRDTVQSLNDGRSHVDDLTDDDVAAMRDAGFIASADPAVLDRAAAITICVPTPLDESFAPDLTAVKSAATTISEHLRPGTVVVLESTTYPGTTEEVVLPILERSGLKAGTDFALAYSPERVDPGNPTFGVANTPKVVGGIDARSTKAAADLYSRFIDTVVTTSGTREAEMAKLLENTYRHVNIALVNEMAIFCHDLGIDLWESIAAAATKPFGFQAFYPGPGVGGHCIPIDPNYLSHKVRSLGYPFRFVELAQEISARMPSYVVARVTRLLNKDALAVNGARVLLLGVTYKKNIADERESPARPIARQLLELGARIEYSDPFVKSWEVDRTLITRRTDVDRAVAEADVVVLLQAHDQFDLSSIAGSARRILDTRGCMHGDAVERL